MTGERAKALMLADIVMAGTLFIMQECLSEFWKLSFTRAATVVNLWGGVYRILSIFFLFLSDTILGNSFTVALSAIFNTAGLVLLTAASTPAYRCKEEKGEAAECVGHVEKVLFITGMSLIALGIAAYIASFGPFTVEQKKQPTFNLKIVWSILIWIMSAIGFFAFPYVRKWYLLFGISAICTASATILYLSGYRKYEKPGPKPEGSPLTVIFRVFVAAAFKISQPFPIPRDDDHTYTRRLHVTAGEEFESLSPTIVLGFLHKAAIIVEQDKVDGINGEFEVKKRSWRVCSVSEVECTKCLIRMVPMWSTFIMSGVVSSIGNTYFIEQASHMNTNIGPWKVPLQFLQLIFLLFGFFAKSINEFLSLGDGGMISSVVCCTVAAVVEGRRLHLARKHHLLDDGDAKVPMSAFFLIFQSALLGFLDGFSRLARRAFRRKELPESMQSLGNCIDEAISGFGFILAALSVYVVGKISETGGRRSWFQPTLNRSRLDRYYWVLAAFSALNLIILLLLACFKKKKKKPDADTTAE